MPESGVREPTVGPPLQAKIRPSIAELFHKALPEPVRDDPEIGGVDPKSPELVNRAFAFARHFVCLAVGLGSDHHE